MPRRTTRRNPKMEQFADANKGAIARAAGMSRAFHGRPAKYETIIEERVVSPVAVCDIGPLVELRIKGVKQDLQFTRKTRLCLSADGKQLYIRGGDQSVNLTQFAKYAAHSIDTTKHFVMLGKVQEVVYYTAKEHLEEADKVPGNYGHTLGGKNGDMPFLVYDRLSQLLSFVGGAYYVDPKDYDGEHSRGIVD